MKTFQALSTYIATILLSVLVLPVHLSANDLEGPVPVTSANEISYVSYRGDLLACMETAPHAFTIGEVTFKEEQNSFTSLRQKLRSLKSKLGQSHPRTTRLRTLIRQTKETCAVSSESYDVSRDPSLTGPTSHEFPASSSAEQIVPVYGQNLTTQTKIYVVAIDGNYLRKPRLLNSQFVNSGQIDLILPDVFTANYHLIATQKNGRSTSVTREQLVISFTQASEPNEPPLGICGDNAIDAGEVCDGNTTSCQTANGYAGVRQCNATCTDFLACVSEQRCGDNIINGLEVCDGSTQACTTSLGQPGQQSCNASCTAYEECVASPPVADAYPWYPSLDLSQIPWHTGAGSWGPQVQLQAPAGPITTRSVTVNTLADFNTQAAISGTEITIGTGWSASGLASVRGSDIDIIIPPGIAIGAIQLGSWPYTTPVQRVRIRGPISGQHSGGRMGQYRDFDLASDIIVDGIDINGAAGFGPGESNHGIRAGSTRFALLNSRVISPGFTWLGSARHVVIANSNFFHGASTRASVGYVEGWGIRNNRGPITIVDSRVEGTRYHNLRVHSMNDSGELLYVTRSTFVGVAEARTAWFWNNLGNSQGIGQGAILENSDIYSYSANGCVFGQEISAVHVRYSRVRNNRFFGGGGAVFTQNYLNSQAAAGGGSPGDHDWTQGNTFFPLVALPAWGGPGDPRQVPLPSGFTLISGEAPCVAPTL